MEHDGDALAVAIGERAEQTRQGGAGHVGFGRVAHLPCAAHAGIVPVVVPAGLAGDGPGVLPFDPWLAVGLFERVLRGGIVADADHAADLVDGERARGPAARVGDAADEVGDELSDAARSVPGFEEPAVAHVDVAEREREDHAAGRAAGRVQVHDLGHGAGRELGSVLDGALGEVAAEAHARVGRRVHGDGQLGHAGLAAQRLEQAGPRGDVRVLDVVVREGRALRLACEQERVFSGVPVAHEGEPVAEPVVRLDERDARQDAGQAAFARFDGREHSGTVQGPALPGLREPGAPFHGPVEHVSMFAVAYREHRDGADADDRGRDGRDHVDHGQHQRDDEHAEAREGQRLADVADAARDGAHPVAVCRA